MVFTKKCRNAVLLSLCGAVCIFAESKDSVVGHWNFLNIRNDTVLDLSGNNNHARLHNTKADPKGRLFKDTQDSCVVTDNTTFYLTKSFSIEAFCVIQGYPAWTSTNSQNHAAILFRGDGRSGNDPYFLTVEPVDRNYDQQWLKYIRFHIESNSPAATDDVGVPADPLLNTPLYITAVLNDATGKMSLYINGVKKTEKSTTVRPLGALVANQGPGVGLGSHPATLPSNTPYRFPFQGILEEIRLVNYPMSDQEITQRYNKGPTQTRLWQKVANTGNLMRSSSLQRVVCLNKSLPINGKKAYTITGESAVSSNKKLTGVFIMKPVK
jgi:hypothetical protein